MSDRTHWEDVYGSRDHQRVSWFQDVPVSSLEMIASCDMPSTARIVDVGGGASRLVDHLLKEGFDRAGVLDISHQALDLSRNRLGLRAEQVEWICDDVLSWEPAHPWDCWHDRAVFHFMIEEKDRRAYRDALYRAVPAGGHIIVAAFGPDGPGRCSGLDTLSCSAEDIARELGSGVRLVEHRTENHVTPGGSAQQFVFTRFVRI